MFGERKVIHVKKEEGEKIKMMHDKRKKYVYKP
jgi:hypothetical protein